MDELSKKIDLLYSASQKLALTKRTLEELKKDGYVVDVSVKLPGYSGYALGGDLGINPKIVTDVVRAKVEALLRSHKAALESEIKVLSAEIGGMEL